MKFFVIFALALSAAFAYDISNVGIEQHNVVVPAVESESVIYNNSLPAAEYVEGRIIKGRRAAIGQFPYQVGLVMNRGSFCGGSLIGRNWVISAAHCLDGSSSVTVYLGSINRGRGEQVFRAYRNNIIIHHGWNSRTFRNDICLIRVPNVTYNSRVQPIRLPSMSDKNPYAGYSVLTSGWGQYYDRGPLSKYLLWGRTVTITNELCRRSFGYYVTHTNICMSTKNGVSSCFGDSGGPLVLESSNILLGISALLKTNLCELGYPASFTRVSSYLDWIKYYTGIYYL